jgi:hypothetical protein
MAFSDAMKAYLKKQGKTDAEIAALEAAADTSGADTASDTPTKPQVKSLHLHILTRIVPKEVWSF